MFKDLFIVFCVIVKHIRTDNPKEDHVYFPLVQDRAFINGEWVEAVSKLTFSVFNPCNSSEIAAVPDMDAEDVAKAINAASAAFKNWSIAAPKERAALLKRWFSILEQNKGELARVMSLESGKPLKESLNEVDYGNSYVEMYAEEATRIRGETLTSRHNGKQFVYLKHPIGVVAIITPWNFPFALLLRKAAAALAAGCCCVVKPAENTPLTALAIAATLQQAGLPPGVLNVVTCAHNSMPVVGRALSESPLVAGLSFTGSTKVGKLMYAQCASGVKRLSLELGGDSPFIVFPSADLHNAVDGALAAKFRNCGQACVSPNKFLVHKKLFDKFVDMLVWKMKNELSMGSSFDPMVNIGPLINQCQLDRITRLVNDAVAKGAKVHIGGVPAKYCGPLYFEPTLLTNVRPEMAVFSEEIFGPIVVCIPFETEEEAISMAHNTSKGLAGYFFTSDITQAWRVAKRLHVGMVGVNEGLISTREVAFGGIKESGMGREGAHYGINEFTFVKTICFGNC